jgi:hypothetical protein
MVSPERTQQTSAAPARDNMTLSAVVYVSGRESAAALDETLFSLAIQDWRDLEIVVALAGDGDELRRRVAGAIESQPWPAAPRYKILSPEAAGAAGARGALLNRGLIEAAGRFLTFVDAGEVVAYQHGYAALIGRLVESGRAVAAGGCRSAHVRHAAGRRFVKTKDDFTLGRTPRGPRGRRLAPVYSHVIDRSRVGEFDLSFRETRRPEGDFLARVYAAFEPDVSPRQVFVCERRLRAGGLEGILYAAARGGYALRGALLRLTKRLRGVAARGAR